MKKYIYVFLGGFPVAKMKKKLRKKNLKKIVPGSWATAHPPALGHDTMVCIVTGIAGCATKGATTRQGKAMTRPSNAATRPRGRLRYGQQHLRARPGRWSVSQYKVLYCDMSKGLAVGGCITIQSLYRDRRAVWLARRATIQMIVS